VGFPALATVIVADMRREHVGAAAVIVHRC